MARESNRTYKARVVLSAQNAFEAGEILDKLTALGKEKGIEVLIDDVEELIY